MNTNPLVEALLATTRSRASWNERLANWEKPPSDNEEEQIARAADQVRTVLQRSTWLSGQNVEVRPQGSYHNNTNVRLQADMDLCVRHPAIKVVHAPNVDQASAYAFGGYYSLGVSLSVLAAQMRSELQYHLANAFGVANVHPGRKAFTVDAIPNSRAPADVVPAFVLHYIRPTQNSSILYPSLETINGVYIIGTDGAETLNYPEQHTRNGILKRATTAHRFKKVVRSMKRLRDELVDLGQLRFKQIPSFLVESLVYRVEDIHFLFDEDRYDRAKRILVRIGEQLNNSLSVWMAMEINGIKPLFSGQPWSLDDAKLFVDLAHSSNLRPSIKCGRSFRVSFN